MTAEQQNDEELEKLNRMILAAQTPTKLFHFTDEEEKRMEQAKLGSARYMAKFGQAPQQPQIDLSHYENSDKTKQHEQKHRNRTT